MPAPRLRHVLRPALLSLLSMLGAPLPALTAAPVTLQFEATVNDVSNGAPFDLPLNYGVGDTIYGRFTFDPDSSTTAYDNGISAIQPFEFVFDINGQVVASSPYEFLVHDNSSVEGSDLGTIDLMILRSLPGTDSQPPLIFPPSGDAFRVRVMFMLVGDPAAIPSNAFPTSSESWNAFEIHRSLNLTFDNAGPGSMGLQAEVSNFRAVPELTSLELFYMGFFVASLSAIFKPRSYFDGNATSRGGPCLRSDLLKLFAPSCSACFRCWAPRSQASLRRP